MDGSQIRRAVFEVIDELSRKEPSFFQTNSVLSEAARRLEIGNNLEYQQALLTFWNDLFRTGHLAWGYNLSNPEPPFCHITEIGRRTLRQLSRDPANPEGYLNHLNSSARLRRLTKSYVEEALKTYNANCFKACAVMIGVASESLILLVRDTLVTKKRSVGMSASSRLKSWRIKDVLLAIENDLNPKTSDMSPGLSDSFRAYWPAFTELIRRIRNDAGHPSSLDPVSQDPVHAALLIFPELAKLSVDLRRWITGHY